MQREKLVAIQRRLSEISTGSYRNFAENYDERLQGLGYSTPATVAQRFGNLFSEGTRILELGVGTGLLARNLAKSGSNWRLIGVDISQEMLDAVPAGLYEELHLGDVSLDLPLEGSSFDGAVALGVSEYIADVEGWFTAVQRLLRPGSPWVFTYVPCAGDTVEQIPGSTMILRHPPAFIADCLARCGFTLLDEEVIPAYSHSGNQIEHRLARATKTSSTHLLPQAI